MGKTKGGFTLPGESGHEKLTLELAEKWGADIIRDSDGTELSPEIINSGYGIYSTICIIRDHNEWARKNMDKLQSTILQSFPVMALGAEVEIRLMDGYFEEQFSVNDSPDAIKYMQVFDRTENKEIKGWKYESGKVYINNATEFHKYTVNFFAWRIWEEISMYNHVTNHWNKEHLMQIDPIYPETREYMLKWMKDWCEEHPATTVARFTSMFYNSSWVFDSKARTLYGDWASYDFTVSPRSMDLFAEEYGYTLEAEDFINKGKMHVTHMPAESKKRDWMKFINNFVISFGKQLIDIVHSYGKKAYVFYDDSWIGVEPWADTFKKFGFDGLIKCVFNGYEVRLCAGCEGVETHEIRLHPYLFPTGLGGSPTFSKGGNPTRDAKIYWGAVRRALLREKIDRIGLGGYLSLTLPFPDFNDYIEKIADEFRLIRDLHSDGKPYTLNPKVAVLTYWGKLRSWTCAGHFHDQSDIDVLNVNEALSGMPFDVEFISFDDVEKNGIDKYDVIINAGREFSSWSGGENWNRVDVVDKITKWTYEGGTFIGVNAPSYCSGNDYSFRLEHILGVDIDNGERYCHNKITPECTESELICEGTDAKIKDYLYVSKPDTEVLLSKDGEPIITKHNFGKGCGFYFSYFRTGNENNRTLMNMIVGSDCAKNYKYISSNPNCECAYFPNNNKLIVINNTNETQTTSVITENGVREFTLDGFDTVIL